MNPTHLTEALDVLVPEILALAKAPGMNIALGIDDRVVWAKGYGHADLATGRPMTPETVGPTGSDAKPYTATAVLQLLDRGLIGLDDPINDHLGGLRVTNPHGGREITLRDLLTHRSGLGSDFAFSDRVPPIALGDLLQKILAEGRTDAYGGSVLPLWVTPVGAHYQYSNVGIGLIGYLVERLNPDGVSFSEWLQGNLFAPLGMASTCFPPAQHPDHVPADLLDRRSTGYATLDGFQFRLPQIHAGLYPAGGALTTPSDHARFLLAIAGGGRLGDVSILTNTTAEAMVSPQAGRGPDPDNTIGYVWNVFQYGSPNYHIGHGGEYMWGWNQVSRVWPERQIAVTASVNQWDLGDLGSSERPSHLAGRLMLNVVDAWVHGADPRPLRSEAAARSYLAGVIVGDRLTARLGITAAPTGFDLDAIVAASSVAAGTPWDAAAFRSGIGDVAAADGTLAGMKKLMGQNLPAHHLAVVQRQLGVPFLGNMVSGK
ncbi:serine hydrolase domain-containing protein [Catenulispora pinisilvae]|uniref:serine hydrolase domain-containing protein n=1 Tax=Catenulispora pinisilvae TaxID=2705253 RepID=UPI001890E6C1|nr:serine hydrolase domain-containing protein [Catenulispora pinisilvae]